MHVPRFLIGIDEAGRAPLAGPVAVGAVLVPADFDFSLVAGVKDSKQLTPLGREKWYRKIIALEAAGMRHVVSYSSAETIDAHGITMAVYHAIASSLKRLGVGPNEAEVRLDGALHAPRKFVNQTTIVNGDEMEPVISLAAIAAKVSRDRRMMKLARRHKGYGFEKHKGYGTKEHYAAIASLGIIPLIHRASFCPR
ncbi:hypothetical protein A3A38_00615 [Candidatus Kaiserbacteria bacterium RIFCSPLOWO2_01_FULL_53_17]|uniref:Ribonuclease n=1 Tax=Candidatus Kaiserbacteria bacterium RIFCSPLOWO2_01_FULL_53_17 TaxID=1798511 RepID=A0A1F6EHL9_9BACT|nr:MAG: hypothetical protein A3A38_00615 [Candidatus Kaiserbacteria bacterium RIFCSPLOWO2_01_FULL_53_17]